MVLYFKKYKQPDMMKITFSPPYTQSRNAFAERSIAVVANMAKAMLKASRLPSVDFWPESWSHAVKIRDLLPRNANPGCKSPYEMRTGKPPKNPAAMYHPFGQPCMVYLPTDQRKGGKLHWDQSRKGRVVGHCSETDTALIAVESADGLRKSVRTSAQYQVDKQLPRGVYSKDTVVLPHEEDKYYVNPQELPTQQAVTENSIDGTVSINQGAKAPRTDLEHETVAIDDPELRVERPETSGAPQAVSSDDTVMEEAILIEPYGPDEEHANYYVVTPEDAAYKESFGTPIGVIHGIAKGSLMAYNLKQAIDRNPEYRTEIKGAATREVGGLIGRCLIPVPGSELTAEDKVFTLISLYTIKLEAGLFDKAKCRCVYPGDAETKGVEYLLCATDMPMLCTMRVFLALAPFENEAAFKADIAQAFPRAELEPIPANERRYVKFPNDITPRGADGRPQIYRAHHGIYGMHGAGRMWQELLFKWFVNVGFIQNVYDRALFTLEGIRVLVWTDDLVIRGTQERTAWLKKKLEETFGDVRWKALDYVLGMDVHRDPQGWLGIHSNSYVRGMIEREGLTQAKPKPTPIPAHVRITKADRAEVIDPAIKLQYQRVLGQISYLATWTRPDLSYPASILGTVAHAPRPQHLKVARRVIAYCKGDPALGLRWSMPDDTTDLNQLIVYSDASWAQEEGYCSQSGYVAMCIGDRQSKSFPR